MRTPKPHTIVAAHGGRPGLLRRIPGRLQTLTRHERSRFLLRQPAPLDQPFQLRPEALHPAPVLTEVLRRRRR
jgi:hypothetical protein